MKQFEVTGKYPHYNAKGEVESTTIQLTSTNEEYACFVETVPGDHTRKDDKTLIELALDSLFKSVYVERAMPEAIQRVDEFEQALQAMKEATAVSDQATQANQEAVAKAIRELNASQGTLLLLIDRCYEKGILRDEDLLPSEADDAAGETLSNE